MVKPCSSNFVENVRNPTSARGQRVSRRPLSSVCAQFRSSSSIVRQRVFSFLRGVFGSFLRGVFLRGVFGSPPTLGFWPPLLRVFVLTPLLTRVLFFSTLSCFFHPLPFLLVFCLSRFFALHLLPAFSYVLSPPSFLFSVSPRFFGVFFVLHLHSPGNLCSLSSLQGFVYSLQGCLSSPFSPRLVCSLVPWGFCCLLPLSAWNRLLGGFWQTKND